VGDDRSDVCTNTEDEPVFTVQAYDGFFLRITDVVPAPAPLFSYLLEAFAEDFTTGNLFHYPKHFPRNADPSYSRICPPGPVTPEG
jgi:hypothetical protein